MPAAICLKCGSAKSAAWRPCTDCGFNPTEDPDSLARSVYLSVGRFDSKDDRLAYQDELSLLADRLRNGEAVNFDACKLARLREQAAIVESVGISDLTSVVFRFFLPGVLFVLALVAVLAILKCL